MKNTEYEMCNNCVMDNFQDENLQINSEGICDCCVEYYKNVLPKWNYGNGHEGELKKLLDKIKMSGINNRYDCILGFSGGMDSAYLLHMAVKEWGLKPLVFHIDSGFDLDIGKRNIEKMVGKLGIDLYVEEIDREDMRNFQIACFRTGLAGCLDYPQDHAFVSILDEYAVKNNIKYILNGYNTSTEVIANPKTHYKNCGQGTDLRFIKDVLRKHSDAHLKNYKFTNVIRRKIILPYIKGVHVVKPLDLIPYKKEEVTSLLVREYGYEPYSQKHFESLMTKFIEGYWLPKRFGFDVRNHQLSSLILTKQMTREDAIKILKEPPITDNEARYLFSEVASRLGIKEEELQKYMEMPLWENKYKKNEWIYKIGAKAMKILGLDNRIRN